MIWMPHPTPITNSHNGLYQHSTWKCTYKVPPMFVSFFFFGSCFGLGFILYHFVWFELPFLLLLLGLLRLQSRCLCVQPIPLWDWDFPMRFTSHWCIHNTTTQILIELPTNLVDLSIYSPLPKQECELKPHP